MCLSVDPFGRNVIDKKTLRVMRAGVGAIIADVTIDLGMNVFKSGNALNIILMFAAFVASWFFKVSAIKIILIFIALGLAMNFLRKKNGGKEAKA